MSRIVIINQPTGNRGDESAHRAFVRRLSDLDSSNEIVVVFFAELKERATQFEVERPNLRYVYLPYIRGSKPIAKYSLKFHLDGITTRLIPVYRKMESIIRSADYVVCAPGGICMGRFMNWNHVFWLKRAQKNNLPIAYYSRSFGPFLSGDKDKEVFKNISLGLLKSFDFLSIRDQKTMSFAEKTGIKYTPSIDTAFLERPIVDIGFLKNEVSNNYVVFVPNSLTWQPDFRMADSGKICEFYGMIIETLVAHYQNHKIVMMPQLFAQGERNDYDFFIRLKNQSKFKDSIVVLPDTMSSDIQQTIINNCEMVIGARYHSIVFAINNERPFVALSYEHKMFGLLTILDLEHRQIDITKIGTDSFDNKEAIKRVGFIMKEPITVLSQHERARSIANECFDAFSKNYLTLPKQ